MSNKPIQEKIIKNEGGCPCSGDCCNNPKIISGADDTHDCEESECGDFCEENYRNECENCGSSCYCDL